jgi:hypothetical protein
VPTLKPVPPPARAAILAWYGASGRPSTFRRTPDPCAVINKNALVGMFGLPARMKPPAHDVPL